MAKNAKEEVLRGYKNKLKNKLYRLLNEYEEKRNWEAFLDNILVELIGFEDRNKTIDYYILFHKLSALRVLNYQYFRTTIFDCMTLVEKMEVS